MADLSIAERVANGVTWLDEHMPDWPSKLSVTVLDIEDCQRCVLGQLFGSFQEAPEVATWSSIHLEGDYVGDVRGFNGSDYHMPLLTEEWRRVITDRQRRAVSR
jgi:hypothetical protein